MKIRSLCIVLISLVFHLQAKAIEVYSLIDENCAITSGFVLSIENEKVLLVGLDGISRWRDLSATKALLIFNTIENPILHLTDSEELRSRLKSIYLGESETPYLTGWPVKFVEDLVIFYDVTGKSYVIDLEQVTRVRPASSGTAIKLNQYRGHTLDFTDSLGACNNRPSFFGHKSEDSSAEGNKENIRPTRILSDQIQIREFFKNYEQGFDQLESYEERTYLYALPFLYERKSRLIFFTGGTSFEQPIAAKETFLFQWARGKPYRFQSFYQLGIFSPRYSPSPEGNFAVRTELKSHAFHAAFMGNLSALAAGSEYYTLASELYDRNPKQSENERSHFAPGFNYMALMGADYLQWSFSIGTYYPSFGFLANTGSPDSLATHKREVLASKVQSIFRIMYTQGKWNMMVLYSSGRFIKDENPTDNDLTVDAVTSSVGFIQNFSLKYEFLKSDASFKWDKKNSMFGAITVIKGGYSETTALGLKNNFEFDHSTMSFGYRREFGDYVALSVRVSQIQQKQFFVFEETSRSEPFQKTQMGGILEFIF